MCHYPSHTNGVQLDGPSDASFGAFTLVRVSSKDNKKRFEKDFDVHPDRPIADVPVIQRDSCFHLLNGVRFSSTAFDLRKSSDAGFDFVSHHVASNQLPKVLVVRIRMRARTYQRHVAHNHVE